MKREILLPITILFLYAAAVCLNAAFRQRLPPGRGEEDIIERIFGGMRVFVGDWAFMKAEEYHHRGLPFEEALAYHRGELMLDERQSRGRAHKERAEVRNAPPAGTGLYAKLYSEVKVTEDSHLKPEEEKEVLPWFYVETAFNPHDLRGYLMGAYWLDRIGKRDAELKFLREGERNNPASAQVLGAIGELYEKEGNYGEAKAYLERSCRLWLEAKGANIVTTGYAESDRLFAFDLLASIYAGRKERDKALAVYREALKFGPNPAILEKVSKLTGENRDQK